MHFDLYHWLFDDPVTAGSNAGMSGAEPFHFLWPWLIFCCAGLLLSFYYSVEGRKRFVKGKPAMKYMLDRYIGWFAIICFIGLPLIGARVALDGYFFAWRFWRYLWIVGMIVWAVLFLLHYIRKYPQEKAYYSSVQNQRKYHKVSNRRAKAASR